MLCVKRCPQWVVLNDSWCHRITQLNEELLSALRPGVTSAVYAPWVAVGLWVLSSRLGHVRDPPREIQLRK